MSSTEQQQPKPRRRNSLVAFIDQPFAAASFSSTSTKSEDKMNDENNTPPRSCNNNNNNIDGDYGDATQISSPLVPAGCAAPDYLRKRSNSFSFTNNNINNNNSSFSSSSMTAPTTSAQQYQNLEIHRKLLDQRNKNARMAKTLKNVKTAMRTKMEKAEQNLMEAEDQFAQMSMRNVKYIDDVSHYDSPKKSVLGIAPKNNKNAAAGENFSNLSRRNSFSRADSSSSSSGLVHHGSDSSTTIDATMFHHKHSGHHHNNHKHLSFNEHHHHSSSLSSITNYQPQPSRSQRSSSNPLALAASGGSVNFQGIRRFGFAAAAMKSLIEKEHCEEAKELKKIQESSVPNQSLAPETHSLFVKNPLQSVTQSLRQFHDQTVDWASEWKRHSNSMIENLCFIFMEEEHHHSHNHHRRSAAVQHHNDSNNNNHQQQHVFAPTKSSSSILRDPRDDFMKELLLISQQSQTLLQEHMLSCNTVIQKILSSVVPEVTALKKKLKEEGLVDLDSVRDGSDDHSSLVKRLSASSMNQPSPFDMAASRLDYSKMSNNKKSIGVQVGNNVTREEELEVELEDVRSAYRRLHSDMLQREQGKDDQIGQLNDTITRLQNRLELLHSCLKIQKEATTAASTSMMLKDSDDLLLTISSTTTSSTINNNNNNNDNGTESLQQQQQTQIEKAMKSLRAQVENMSAKSSTNAATVVTSTTSSTLSSLQNSATNSPSPMRSTVVGSNIINNNQAQQPQQQSAFKKLSSSSSSSSSVDDNSNHRSSSIIFAAAKESSPDDTLEHTLTPNTPPPKPHQQQQVTSAVTAIPISTSTSSSSQIVQSIRARINSARSSATVTPVDTAISSLNTTNVLNKHDATAILSGTPVGDVSFTSSSSNANDHDNENEGERSLDGTPSRKETAAIRMKQVSSQYANTPPVKLPQTTSMSIVASSNNINIAGIAAAPPPLSAKPRSASKRNSIVSTTSNSSATSSTTTTPRTAISMTDTSTTKLPSLTNSTQTQNKQPLGKMMTNTATVTNAHTSSRNNAKPGSAAKLNCQQQQQVQQQHHIDSSTNTNSNIVQVSSSLKRMEEWKDHQSQLWQRRRSQLEKHSSYDGMLKLSSSADQATSNIINVQMNAASASQSTTPVVDAVPLSSPTVSHSAPVFPAPSSFVSHDVLVDHTYHRRNSFSSSSSNINGSNNNGLVFAPKRR